MDFATLDEHVQRLSRAGDLIMKERQTRMTDVRMIRCTRGMRTTKSCCAVLIVCSACGGLDEGVASDLVRLADVVIEAPGASGSGFGDPMNAVNGVRGGGPYNGSLDVYSLAFPPALNQSITLGWSSGRLANGPGADLVVFENPFLTQQGAFMDLVIVEVSRDGSTWRELAHDYVTADETIYVREPDAWVGFAGKTPVLLDTMTHPVDPFDAAAAGGDAFDLDMVVGDDAEAIAIRAEGVTQVRLVTARARTNPDTAAPFVVDSFSNGADIDGVFGRYVEDVP